jgi:two-component system response regulator PilR (NtrC family)
MMKGLGIVGESPAMISVFRWILRVSRLSDLPALITGETGTGKELLAHAIHQLDPKRRSGPFVAVNCGAISAGLAESEFFGHRRGAYTGALQARRGLIRSAEGGILFLDEIGELGDDLQAKLLRVLQDNRVLAVGEDREVAVNVRILAASNRDLHRMVEQGRFRADLYYRVKVLSIQIPPLRERPGDLEPMIRHFLGKYQHLNPLASHSVGPDLPPEVWRELSDRGKDPSVQADQGRELRDMRRPSRKPPGLEIDSSLASLLDGDGWSLSRSIQYCERVLLEAALHRTHGNQSQTARLLGITPRSVYNKVRKHYLNP